MVALSIFLWVKVRRSMPSNALRMLVKQATGSCSRMCISWLIGWRTLNSTLRLSLKRERTMISDASFHLSHHPYHIWKSFLSLFYRTLSRLQTKLQRILSPTLGEPSVNSIKLISRKPKPTKSLTLRLCYSDFACTTLSFSVELNLALKDGQGSTITTMVTWEFAVKSCTTTWQHMRRYHILIFNISTVRSCMVVTLQTTGTGELTRHILKSWSDQPSWRTCSWQCLKVSDRPTRLRPVAISMRPRLMNCHLRILTCSVFTRMPKLVT